VIPAFDMKHFFNPSEDRRLLMPAFYTNDEDVKNV
jgi:hypothetical protein